MKIVEQLFKYYLAMVDLFFIGRLFLFILYFDRFNSSDVNY